MPLHRSIIPIGSGGTGVALGAPVMVGRLIGANMNTTDDQAIPLTLPSGVTLWMPFQVRVLNASASLTTAAGGVYSTTAKGGFAMVPNTQAYSTLTAAAVNSAGSGMACTITATAVLNVTTVYLSLTTPQGAAATADFYVFAYPFA